MKFMKTDQIKIDFIYYVWLFFLIAVFGWIWEGFLYLFKDDTYVNRGFLTGPWLPIYGMGAIMLGIAAIVLFVADAAYSAIIPRHGAGITYGIDNIDNI